jgi:hypothetical protein
MTSLSDFYDKLAAHVWTHAMSDDYSVFMRGRLVQDELVRISGESDEHKKLYVAYKAYGWGKGPRPERPMEKAFRGGQSEGS